MTLDNFLRAAAVCSVLIAGSCAAPSNDGNTRMEDGAVNHPIAVTPSYRELKVQYAGAVQGMNADDALQFDAFLADYRSHGNGSLGISVPNGAPAHAAIAYFGERAAASGIARDKILVSTHDVQHGDYRVAVSYIAYQAHADSCGDWSENLSFTADNETPKNFGCSVQHNIAAMVADPRDLVTPHGTETADGKRSATVLDNYEQGKITSADKRKADLPNEQSGASSNINN
jgi:pilus assembly protein CpaD